MFSWLGFSKDFPHTDGPETRGPTLNGMPLLGHKCPYCGELSKFEPGHYECIKKATAFMEEASDSWAKENAKWEELNDQPEHYPEEK